MSQPATTVNHTTDSKCNAAGVDKMSIRGDAVHGELDVLSILQAAAKCCPINPQQQLVALSTLGAATRGAGGVADSMWGAHCPASPELRAGALCPTPGTGGGQALQMVRTYAIDSAAHAQELACAHAMMPCKIQMHSEPCSPSTEVLLSQQLHGMHLSLHHPFAHTSSVTPCVIYESSNQHPHISSNKFTYLWKLKICSGVSLFVSVLGFGYLDGTWYIVWFACKG